MSSYFINNGKFREGPFTPEELLQKGVRKETLVWRDGYTDWLAAGDIPELAELLRNSAPVFKSFGTDTAIPVDYKKKEAKANWSAVVWTILLTILLALIIWLIAANTKRNPPEPDTNASVIFHTA